MKVLNMVTASDEAFAQMFYSKCAYQKLSRLYSER